MYAETPEDLMVVLCTHLSSAQSQNCGLCIIDSISDILAPLENFEEYKVFVAEISKKLYTYTMQLKRTVLLTTVTKESNFLKPNKSSIYNSHASA